MERVQDVRPLTLRAARGGVAVAVVVHAVGADLLFGPVSGTVDPSAADVRIDGDSTSDGFTGNYGHEALDASGDFDGDGYADLAVASL